MSNKNRKFHQIVPDYAFIFHSRRPEPGLFTAKTDLDDLCPERYKAVTIAVLFRDGMVVWGVGRCGKRGQFARKIGRSVAVGRAKKTLYESDGRIRTIPQDRKEAFTLAKEVARNFLKGMAGEHDVINITREAQA
jgi:hypothetical protein